jgi:hypothetical protein
MLFIRDEVVADKYGRAQPTGRWHVTSWTDWHSPYEILGEFDTREQAVAHRKLLWQIQVDKQRGDIPL